MRLRYLIRFTKMRLRRRLQTRQKDRTVAPNKAALAVVRFAKPVQLIIAGQFFGMLGVVLFLLSNFLDVPFLRESALTVIAFGAVVSGLGRIAREQEQRREIERKEVEVRDIQSVSPQNETLRDFLLRQVKAAVKREELTLLKTERRADSLHFWGVALLITSIACPIAAAVFYWALDPLPSETLLKMRDLKLAVGELPKDLRVEFARDWRILVGGATFGFLCLAVARGLLTQQGRETETYFRIEEKINYYERLGSAIEIKLRQLDDAGNVDSELAAFVVEGLRGYRRDNGKGSEEAGGPETDKQTTAIQEFTKAIFDAAKATRAA